MPDLVEFLTARLRDDEQLARSVPGPSWERRQITSTFDESEVFEDYVAVADPERNRVVLSDVDAKVLPFVLRNDPARVLREVEAKRRILERHRPEYHLRVRDGEYVQDEAPHCPDHLDDRPWPCADVRDVAAVYADHPDYREEWRP